MSQVLTQDNKPKKKKPVQETEQVLYSIHQSSLGQILIAHKKRGVCCVLFDPNPVVLVDQLRRHFPHAALSESSEDGKGLADDVICAIESSDCEGRVPLDMGGTEFQERVWRALLEIPGGTTSTYTKIAKLIGAPNAVRAVGTACGANRIAVLIPCHRVIASSGGLSGYRWGLELKRALLEREAARANSM